MKNCEYIVGRRCLLLHKYRSKNPFATLRFCKENCEHCGPLIMLENIGFVLEILPSAEKLQKEYSKKMPPIKQQLKNAANATGQAIKSGFKTVSKEEQEKRFEICEQCEFLTDKILKRCSKCGCCMKLKKKLEAWHCPIDRW